MHPVGVRSGRRPSASIRFDQVRCRSGLGRVRGRSGSKGNRSGSSHIEAEEGSARHGLAGAAARQRFIRVAVRDLRAAWGLSRLPAI
jgi:hypothetical protein